MSAILKMRNKVSACYETVMVCQTLSQLMMLFLTEAAISQYTL